MRITGRERHQRKKGRTQEKISVQSPRSEDKISVLFLHGEENPKIGIGLQTHYQRLQPQNSRSLVQIAQSSKFEGQRCLQSVCWCNKMVACQTRISCSFDSPGCWPLEPRWESQQPDRQAAIINNTLGFHHLRTS